MNVRFDKATAPERKVTAPERLDESPPPRSHRLSKVTTADGLIYIAGGLGAIFLAERFDVLGHLVVGSVVAFFAFIAWLTFAHPGSGGGGGLDGLGNSGISGGGDGGE